MGLSGVLPWHRDSTFMVSLSYSINLPALDLGYIQFAAMKKQTPLFIRKGDWFLVSILRLQFLGSNINLTRDKSQDRSSVLPERKQNHSSHLTCNLTYHSNSVLLSPQST